MKNVNKKALALFVLMMGSTISSQATWYNSLTDLKASAANAKDYSVSKAKETVVWVKEQPHNLKEKALDLKAYWSRGKKEKILILAQPSIVGTACVFIRISGWIYKDNKDSFTDLKNHLPIIFVLGANGILLATSVIMALKNLPKRATVQQ